MAEMKVMILDVHRRVDGIIVANCIFHYNAVLVGQHPIEFIGSDTEVTAMDKINAKAQELYDSIKRESTLDFNKHIGKTLTVTVV